MKIDFKSIIFLAILHTSSVTSDWTQVGSDIDGRVAGDQSGSSLAFSSNGSVVVIGAPYHSNWAGCARVYRNINENWIQVGDDIVGEGAGNRSGMSLDISADGSVVAIGAPYNGGYLGHTRIYRNIDDSWVQIGDDIDGETIPELFGSSLAISEDGTVVAIGADWSSANGAYSGRTRVYRYTNVGWVQMGDNIDGTAAYDFSGRSLAISFDGNVVAIGSPKNGSGSGHTRVYRYINDSWIQIGNDMYGDAAGDRFGFSLAMSSNGSVVAVGAPGFESGRTRVYQYINGFWLQMGNIIEGESYGEWSGESLAMSSDGSVLVVGARHNGGNGKSSGLTRVYRYIDEAWIQMGTDIRGEAVEDESGSSLAMSADGSVIAIGAPFNDGNGDSSGHTRIFSYTLNDSTTLPTVYPTVLSSSAPTKVPSIEPSIVASKVPIKNPSITPSRTSSLAPTKNPSISPSRTSSVAPTKNPSMTPSTTSSVAPTKNPSMTPSTTSSVAPTKNPSITPSRSSSIAPTKNTSISPSRSLSVTPSWSSDPPTSIISNDPTLLKSSMPSRNPSSNSSANPTEKLSHMPSKLTSSPPSLTFSSQPSVALTYGSTAPTALCVDFEDWKDNDGDGCEWYEQNDSEGCPTYGNYFDGGMGTPNEACCWCGGGNVSCSAYNNKRRKCNNMEGCSFIRSVKKCKTALSTTDCAAYNDSKRKCRRMGCRYKKDSKTCIGRWN